MTDPITVRANERRKLLSQTAVQLASALLAAAAVKIYTDAAISTEAASWVAMAIALAWGGLKFLDLLEAEE